MGNMRDDLARKSIRLFTTQVAPRLRDELRVIFAKHFKELSAHRRPRPPTCVPQKTLGIDVPPSLSAR